tara:strand:- start:73 stop:1140 length:1068 start_codon:yes stop_codon:yes gene_type:complete
MQFYYHKINNIKVLNLKYPKPKRVIKKDVLIISNNSRFVWANSIEALKKIKFNYKKIIYQTNSKKLKFSILTRILIKFKFFIDEFKIHDKIKRELKRKKYDEIIFIQPFYVSACQIKKLKKLYPYLKFSAIFIDPIFKSNYFTFNILFSLKLFDKIIYRQPFFEIFFKIIRHNNAIRCFPGSNFAINKIKNNKYVNDVTFIGSYEKERANDINFLANNGIVINIYGNGWENKLKGSKNIKLNEPIYGKEFFKKIYSSKINLAFLRKKNNDVYNSKTVEILSAGGFMMSEYSSYIEKFFKKNVHVIYFLNKEDLLKKIIFYLQNNKKREMIKKSAFDKYKKLLTNYSDQLTVLLKN